MDEASIKLEMRLSAIEYLLSKLYATMIAATGLSSEQIEQKHREFLAGARQQIFPGLDPAMSDLASAEWEAAIERLIKMQKEMLGAASARRGS